jgi:membrane protease YdiL (CAAX protease family)
MRDAGSNQVSPTGSAAGRSILERRPILSAIGVLLLAKVAMIVSTVAPDLLLGGTLSLAGAAVTAGLLCLIAFTAWRALVRHGWSSMVGFNPPRRWREPWLIWLPALLVLVNLSNLIGAEIGAYPDWRLLMDAAVRGITVPLVEETIFRGLILAIMLNRFHASSAQVLGSVMISSLLFGLWHLPPNPSIPWQQSVANVVYAIFMGVGFAAVVIRTRSIWLGMVVHGLIVFGNGLATALLAGSQGTVAQLIRPEDAWRSALLSVAVTMPLFLYGVWLLRDRRKVPEVAGERRS